MVAWVFGMYGVVDLWIDGVVYVWGYDVVELWS